MIGTRRIAGFVGFLALTAAALPACSKSEEGGAATAVPASTPNTSGAPTASASAAPSAGASASASASAAPSASASANVKTAALLDGSATEPCGDKPLPDCPLKKWMKANTAAAMAAQDMDAVATAFDQIATMGPQGYTNWGSIARDGAAAARAHNADGAKAACRGCHEQYKSKYKAEMRDRPL